MKYTKNERAKYFDLDFNMKKAFTIVEVSILFVIFLIVAFLVAPLSLDDTIQAKNTARWKTVQGDFDNIFYSVNTKKNDDKFVFNDALNSVMQSEVKLDITPYKIRYMNGSFPDDLYAFKEYSLTYSNATVAYKLFDKPTGDNFGIMMYDVNGQASPNTWGKDVFGYNITANGFEPLCKKDSITNQKKDCARNGTGLCCSNYYLIGGSLR